MKQINRNFTKDNITYFNIDSLLFILLFFISLFGLLILYSATNHSLDYVEKQFYRILLGFIVMIVVSKIPASSIKMFSPHLFLLTIFLLILVVLFGTKVNGATRWLNLYFFNFQPSEFAKLTVPMFLAFYIQDNSLIKNNINIITSLSLLILPTLLILVEPDLGTALLIFTSGFIILFVSGFPFSLILYGLTISAISFPFMWIYILKDYQKQRISTMFNPESDPLGSGYHIIQSKISIGSGGFWGQGWLEGIQTHLSYVPEQHTDFIFSVLAEEFGFLGFLWLSLLYFFLIARVFYLIKKMKVIFYKLTSIGLISAIIFYIFVNIGMVSGIIPVVGLPLPFISYGGSSLLILFLIFGIISSFSNESLK
jgi:rod shape determining protein RodA